jgi:hypothetical protein
LGGAYSGFNAVPVPGPRDTTVAPTARASGTISPLVSAGTTNRIPNADSRIAMVLIREDLPEPMVPKMPMFGFGSSPAR